MAEHAHLLGTSTVPIIRELFAADAAATATGGAAADAIAVAAGSELPSPRKADAGKVRGRRWRCCRAAARGTAGRSAQAGALPALPPSQLTPPPAAATPQGGRKSAFMLSSVGARFRKQLAGLMGTLGQCQPHYIRWVGGDGSGWVRLGGGGWRYLACCRYRPICPHPPASHRAPALPCARAGVSSPTPRAGPAACSPSMSWSSCGRAAC